MRCADARRALSARFDDELDTRRASALRDHVGGCRACAAYDEHLHSVRAALRIAPVEHVPDLATRVRARLDEYRPRPRPVRARSLVAAFAAAFVAGASFVGLTDGPDPVGARDLSGAVVRAQRSVESLVAEVGIVERGWHPAVPERVLRGRVVYRAPESFALTLRDDTSYPSDDWVRDDVDVVIDGATSWERAVVRCPRDALPGCTPREPRVRTLVGREPFPDATPAPLDLVVPVRSFARSAAVEDLGTRRIGSRDAVGVRVTAAQVDPLLRGLRGLGNARELHPTDLVELWLDGDSMVPLALDVRAAPTEERAEWGARHGYDDGSAVVLSVRWSGVVIDGPVPAGAFDGPPSGGVVRDAGFAVSEPHLDPGWLPPGMRPVREGVVRVADGPEVRVGAWSDGVAWVKVGVTGQWAGGRLFGDLGPVVREVATASGVVYVDERGERVALHAPGQDLVVTGSVATDELVRVATSLGVAGETVPSSWDEAATVDLDELRGANLLLPASEVEPAARRTGETVTLAYAGPGARGFLVVEAPGTQLAPPFDPDARAVELRGTIARWSPQLGTLEWVEDGLVIALTSRTLALGEVVALAEGMAQP